MTRKELAKRVKNIVASSLEQPVSSIPVNRPPPLPVPTAQLGSVAVEILRRIVASAKQKLEENPPRDLTRSEYETVWKIASLQPDFLRNRAFDDTSGESEETAELSKLSPDELVALAKGGK